MAKQSLKQESKQKTLTDLGLDVDALVASLRLCGIYIPTDAVLAWTLSEFAAAQRWAIEAARMTIEVNKIAQERASSLPPVPKCVHDSVREVCLRGSAIATDVETEEPSSKAFDGLEASEPPAEDTSALREVVNGATSWARRIGRTCTDAEGRVVVLHTPAGKRLYDRVFDYLWPRGERLPPRSKPAQKRVAEFEAATSEKAKQKPTSKKARRAARQKKAR